MGKSRVARVCSDDGVEKKECFLIHAVQNWTEVSRLLSCLQGSPVSVVRS